MFNANALRLSSKVTEWLLDTIKTGDHKVRWEATGGDPCRRRIQSNRPGALKKWGSV